MENTSFLITGGAGFIGSHIANYLVENKAKKVIVFDNLSTGSMKNINHLLDKENFEFCFGDICNINECESVISRVDIICHQAALGSVPRSIEEPINTHNINATGFLNILETARKNNIKRIVYASSSAVYGDNENLPKKEDSIGKPMSPYGISKYIDELYAYIYTKLYGMECIGLRYFNVYGPKQNPNGPYAAVIPKFICALMNDESPIINGDGSYSRDFTYVDNIVSANIKSMHTINQNCFGEVFNIGTNEQITIIDLYNQVCHYLNKDIDPIFIDIRKGDIAHSLADITKANELLEYEPLIKFNDGIKSTIDFFVHHYQ